MVQRPLRHSRGAASLDSSLNFSRRRFVQQSGAGMLALTLPAAYAASSSSASPTAPPPYIDPAYGDAINWGRQQIAIAMAEPNTAAISIALFRNDRMIWQEAFGQALREEGIAATPDTRFNIGSVSKVLAALAAMILQDRGLIRLDAPITTYMPKFRMLSDAYRQITVRDLLCHSSGLPGTNARNIFGFAPIPGYADDTEAALANTHLKHVPGEMAVYCNDGFTLVEQIVLAVTGRSYPDFVQQEILQPLDMIRSGYSLAAFPKDSFAHPYFRNRLQGQEFVMAYASGGLASTPGDMMKLARMFLDGGVYGGKRILSAAAVAEMGSNQAAALQINPTPEWCWGLGWDFSSQRGMHVVGVDAWSKNGGTAFYSTEFFVLPKARLALLLTGSNASYNPLPIVEGVLLRTLLKDRVIVSLPLQAQTDTVLSSGPDSNAEMYGAGIYGNYNAPFKAAFTADHTLTLQQWEEAPEPGMAKGAWKIVAQGLRYRIDGWWSDETQGSSSYRFAFVKEHRYLIERKRGGVGHYLISTPIGEQLKPLSPLSAAWKARIGTRWSSVNESPDSVALHLTENLATLRDFPDLPGYLFWNGEQLLKPLSDTRAGMTVQVPVAPGRDLNEIVVMLNNGAEQLTVGSIVYAPAKPEGLPRPALS